MGIVCFETFNERNHGDLVPENRLSRVRTRLPHVSTQGFGIILSDSEGLSTSTSSDEFSSTGPSVDGSGTVQDLDRARDETSFAWKASAKSAAR